MLKRTLLAGAVAVALALAMPAAAADQNSTFLTKQAPDERFANAIIGTPVQDSAGEKVGKINDLILGPRGNVTGAVIGVGGFLGIGEKNVAMPFDRLTPKTGKDDEKMMAVAVSKQDLQNAPDYMDSEGKPLGVSRQFADKAKEEYEKAKEKAAQGYDKAKEQAAEAYNKAKERVDGQRQ